jgi:hypothetical protein
MKGQKINISDFAKDVVPVATTQTDFVVGNQPQIKCKWRPGIVPVKHVLQH